MTARPYWAHRSGRIAFGDRAQVMAILNVTPDSFSDGGQTFRPEIAVAAARRLAAEGADILDIGGQSTRPGHTWLAAGPEWGRIAPVFAALAADPEGVPPLSVDTWQAEVAEKAIAKGAAFVNDVWGLQRDRRMAGVAAGSGVGLVLMHNREKVDAGIDIVDDILRFLDRSLTLARAAGVAEDRIVLDPGLGFGKAREQNFAALAALPRLRALGFPILIGLSRKSFIGSLTEPPRPVTERLAGTIAGNMFAIVAGADIIRVHDVAAHVQAVRMLAAIGAAA